MPTASALTASQGSLRDNALQVLIGWSAPDAAGHALRRLFVELLGSEPGAVRRDHAGAHLTASTLVVDADRERVLLCLHGRFYRWVQLGGHCEDGDATLAGAALREATEESGIDGLVVHSVPIDLDIHRVDCRSGPSLHYDVRFAALAPPGAVEEVSSESRALGWFHPDALPEPLAHATARLAGPALAAVAALGRP
jgi:8-oxo-dGTP pyrophosphatase MutT (NUDIX family)